MDTGACRQLEELVVSVARSPKYRGICPELVRGIGARELDANDDLREATKQTKTKLHQVIGIYRGTRPDYAAVLAALRRTGSPDETRAACFSGMRLHRSTKERLPILTRFYQETLGGIESPRTVLDIACGLDPLAIPWMPLSPGATYLAFDADADITAFVGDALPLMGVQGSATACDVTTSPPRQRADLALVLKVLPCLEQLRRGAGERLLDALDAEYLLVSFPTRGVSGRDRGMAEHYERSFLELASGRPWQVQRFEFPGELAFLVRKGGRS